MYLLITALLLIGPAFAQVSQQSDGQHYGGGETTITWEQSSSMETALFSSLAITEADHTETIIVPVNTEVGPLTWSSMAITEADYTETIPVPVPVSTESGPLSWSSLAITEADHTETVPVPVPASRLSTPTVYTSEVVTTTAEQQSSTLTMMSSSMTYTTSLYVPSQVNVTITSATPSVASYTGAAVAHAVRGTGAVLAGVLGVIALV
ncbi:hypothetical protein M433DRAFT_6782 [Acidomyces richmondensis BFW]|nr:hypothetical protein M433DRAFT_6782 [Acidomyces richmondensis BFW]